MAQINRSSYFRAYCYCFTVNGSLENKTVLLIESNEFICLTPRPIQVYHTSLKIEVNEVSP